MQTVVAGLQILQDEIACFNRGSFVREHIAHKDAMARLQEAGEGRIHLVPTHPGQGDDIALRYVEIGGDGELVMGNREGSRRHISDAGHNPRHALQSAEQNGTAGIRLGLHADEFGKFLHVKLERGDLFCARFPRAS